MIPVTDSVTAHRFPFVNITIILVCIGVFIYQLTLSQAELVEFFHDYGVVPADLTDWLESPEGVRQPASVLTSAFLHGGWLHLIGNMLFLWVFGDNVEDAIGHVLYALFYAVAAAGAVALQVAVIPNEAIPMVGVSGAIAGVLGAYLVLYPKAVVGVVIPLLWFFGAFPVPAVVLIVLWFVMQVFAGVATLGAETAQGGVAFWAHIGGFVTGFAIMLAARPLIPKRQLSRPKPRRRRGSMW
jgi:membrane associated rhomboid family serine protease